MASNGQAVARATAPGRWSSWTVPFRGSGWWSSRSRATALRRREAGRSAASVSRPGRRALPRAGERLRRMPVAACRPGGSAPSQERDGVGSDHEDRQGRSPRDLAGRATRVVGLPHNSAGRGAQRPCRTSTAPFQRAGRGGALHGRPPASFRAVVRRPLRGRVGGGASLRGAHRRAPGRHHPLGRGGRSAPGRVDAALPRACRREAVAYIASIVFPVAP